MNFQDMQAMYHSMPAKFRNHGDMPTYGEMSADVDDYMLSGEYDARQKQM